MHAIGFQQPGSIDREALSTLSCADAAGRDILVEVKAVSVNPVDVKIRQSAKPDLGDWKVIGWDAAGVVIAVGPDVTLFQPGDTVFYARCARPGTNAEYHLVRRREAEDAGWAAAAALPLTSRPGKPCSIDLT